MPTIGEKIREARLQRGMTQTELSANLVTASMISQIESDKVRPSYPLLMAISDRLGVPAESFMDQTDAQQASGAYDHLARCYLYFGRSSEALELILDSPIPDQHTAATSFRNHQLIMADALRMEKQYTDASNVIESLREFALQTQDHILQFHVCKLAGHLEYDTGNVPGAIHEWNTATDIGESLTTTSQFLSTQLDTELAHIFLNLYKIHLETQDHERAKSAIEAAFERSQRNVRLDTIADALVADGLTFMDKQETSGAQDAFYQASIITELSSWMQRAVQIHSEHQRLAGQTPQDPWTMTAIAATTVHPTGFLDCEIRTIGHLLSTGGAELAEQRIEYARRVIQAYGQQDERLVAELHRYTCQLEIALARVHYVRGERESAIDRLKGVRAEASAHQYQQEWTDASVRLIQWFAETDQPERAVQYAEALWQAGEEKMANNTQ